MDESLRRHATRPQAAGFGPDDMRQWHRPKDLLSSVSEHVIPETSTLRQTIRTILAETQLLQTQACTAPGSGQPLVPAGLRAQASSPSQE